MDNLSKELERWLVMRKKNSVKPATLLRYYVTIDLLNKYRISQLPIEYLNSDDIQGYFNHLVEDGYSKETIMKQKAILFEFLKSMYLEGRIQRPFYQLAKIPSDINLKHKKRDVTAYTREEQEKLLRIIESDDIPAYYAAILMLETGMRSGEVLGLCWSDVQWSRKAIKICRTTVKSARNTDRYLQNTAKTANSNRLIPLSSKAYSLLRRLYERNQNGIEYIFHDDEGKLLSYDYLKYWIAKACKEAGVPYHGQHVFRHTFATNCYHKGCDVKVLSKLLGHSNPAITYNIYIHLYGDGLEEMRSILD